MNGWWIDMEDRRVLVEYNVLAGFEVFRVLDGHGNSGHALDYVAGVLRA
jgi:hypothetical protein